MIFFWEVNHLKQAMTSLATLRIAEGTESDDTWHSHFPQCAFFTTRYCSAGVVASAGKQNDMLSRKTRRSMHAEASSADRAG